MFSAIREGRSWGSHESCRRPEWRRRRVGALSGAAGLVAVVGLALPSGALAQTNFSEATNLALGNANAASDKTVAVGDFNGDKDPDLAVTNPQTSSVQVLLGRPGGAGFTQAPNNRLANGPLAVAVGQLNIATDTKLDLVVAMGGSGGPGDKLAVLLGKGDGTFGAPSYVSAGSGSGPASVAVGRIDRDQYPDLAVANNLAETVGVLHGNGDGTFGAPASYAAGHWPIAVALGNFDADSFDGGHLDLAVANAGSSDISVRYGNSTGDPPFGSATSWGIGNAPIAMAMGDFDANQHPDLALANTGNNTVSVLAAGNGMYPRGSYAVGEAPTSVAVGNFNHDADPDLAVTYQRGAVSDGLNGGVSVLLGETGTSFRRMQTDYAAGDRPNSVATGDFDGDSDSDLAVANRYDDNISVLLANNAPTANADAYNTDVNSPLSVTGVGMLTNDRDPDGDQMTAVLASGPAHGTVTIDSDGSFRYTPTAGFTGSDSFSYTVSDGHGGWNVGTVAITIFAPGA